MRLVSLAGIATSLVACSLYGSGPEVCKDKSPPSLISLVNPQTLQCQSFGGTSCDASCGPCPADRAPIPTWGRCDSACGELDELACEAAAQCRVARDWNGYYANSTASFIGCYPVDMQRDPPTDLAIGCAGRDAQGCSRNPDCSGLYSQIASEAPCNSIGCALDSFVECIPEHQVAGTCFLPTLCDIAGPSCPQGTTPGIANGCYTGACIPIQLCPLYPPD